MSESKSDRILIVDDTPRNIQVLGTILKDQGYQLNVAQNGLQALERLRRRRLQIQWVHRRPGVAHPHPRYGRTCADIRCRVGGLILLPPHPHFSGVKEQRVPQ